MCEPHQARKEAVPDMKSWGRHIRQKIIIFFTHNLCGRCNSIVPRGWTDGFSYNTWQLGQGRANTVISSEIKLHTALLYYHNLKACYIILKYQLKVAARQYSWIGILKSKYFYILKMHIYLCKQGFIWINMNAICRPDFEICEIKYDAFILKKWCHFIV